MVVNIDTSGDDDDDDADDSGNSSDPRCFDQLPNTSESGKMPYDNRGENEVFYENQLQDPEIADMMGRDLPSIPETPVRRIPRRRISESVLSNVRRRLVDEYSSPPHSSDESE